MGDLQDSPGFEASFKELSKCLGGKLAKRKKSILLTMWEISGNRAGTEYLIELFESGNVITVKLSVFINTPYEFRLYQSLGLVDTLKKVLGAGNNEFQIGISGRNVDEGKRFLAYNKDELMEIFKINPFKAIAVKDGAITTSFDSRWNVHSERVTKSLDALTKIAKKEAG